MKSFDQHFGAAARVIGAGVFATALALGTSYATAATHPSASGADRMETHIKTMHSKLRITPEQEDKWQTVAQVMRDNESAMQPLIEQRRSNTGSMTAVDDLHSYQGITEAHLDGIKKLTPAFETLYASLDDSQKRQADMMFRGEMHKKHMAK